MNLKCRGCGYFVMAGKSGKRWHHNFNGNPYCSSWPGKSAKRIFALEVPAIHVLAWWFETRRVAASPRGLSVYGSRIRARLHIARADLRPHPEEPRSGVSKDAAAVPVL